MKIAFVYDTAFPWVTGGAERRIYEISTRLTNHGHDVHIFSLGFWMNSDEFRNQEVIKYDNITYHSVGEPVDLYTKNNTRSIKEALYFTRKVLSVDFSDFDIVDCQGFPYFSCYSSKLKTRSKKTHLVITLHEIWNDYWYEYMGKIGIVGKMIEKGILHLTDNIICVSELTKANMLKNHDPKNTVIIPNGVNCEEIFNLDVSEEYCDVLFAGRLIPEKNSELLVKAISKVVKKHPDVKCFIIGDGPVKDDLANLIVSLNLEKNVFIKGFLDNQTDLYKIMKNSTVFVLPSKREGFGIVVIEANACGLPVITIDNPMNAAKDLINDNNGWVVEESIDALAQSLIYILDEGVSSDMKKDCVENSKNYDWNYIADLTEDYYMKVLQKKKFN